MRGVLSCLLALAVTAAEPPAPADPYGLGERLALLDHLREAYGLRPAAGATLAELRAVYSTAWAARQPREVEADAGRVDRERRLRQRLADRYGVEAGPGVDEAGLQSLLRRLEAERAARDAAVIDALAAADRAAAPPAVEPAPLPAPAPLPVEPPRAAPVAAVQTPAAPEAAMRQLAFTAKGVSSCRLVGIGERQLLLVTFGVDHNGAFRGIPEGVAAIFAQAPAIRRAVLLLGHGGGNAIADESIAGHLKANRAFYESMGGTAAAMPVDCMVFAACAGGGQSQMTEMRDGLGYWPTWRVASGDFTATTGLNVIVALAAVAARPSQPAWRGLFRLRLEGRECVSFGDVGVGGERAETDAFRIVRDEQGGWKLEEQR